MSGLRIETDLLVQQIAHDEQRATPRDKRRPIILTAFRNFWALLGLLIVALFVLFMIALVRMY
jgi:CHASE3 domain sensor protein